MRSKFAFVLIFVLLGCCFFGSAATKFGASGTNSVQYYSPSISDIYSGSEISTYWKGLEFGENDTCEAINAFCSALCLHGKGI